MEAVGHQPREQRIDAPSLLELGFEDAPEEHVDDGGHRLVAESVPQPAGHARADLGRGDGAVDQLPAQFVVGENVGQKITEVEDIHSTRPQQGGELVVFEPGALEPDQVVEEQRVLVVGGDPRDLDAGSVNQHGAKGADLAVYRR